MKFVMFRQWEVFLISVFTYLLNLTLSSASSLQVVKLIPGQTYDCCKSTFYRSEPMIYCHEGREKHIVHLWETLQLQLSLRSDEFEQFDGFTPEEVKKKFDDRKASWYFYFYTSKKKVIRLNPFNSTCVGIVTNSDYSVKLTKIRVDYWRVLMMVSGLVLFLLAPKLSSNSIFYYLCGCSFGMCASILILVYIISRLMPRKPVMYSFLAGGWAVGLYVVQFLWDNVRTIAMDYQAYVLYYLVFTCILSFVICYRLGPISDPRSINLITWLLQGVGLLLILFSSYFQEATLAFIIIILTFYIIPFLAFFRLIGRWMRRFGPKPVPKLLTEDEYYQQGVEETRKALDELRGYCSSPECNQWKTVLRLHNPVRFAKFIEGSSHLEDEEVLSFEMEDKDELLTDDDSDSSSSDSL